MSDKYIKAVANYERCRVKVNKLKKRRAELFESCTRETPTGKAETEYSMTCLELCWEDCNEGKMDHGYSFDFKSMLGEYSEDNGYCDNCKEAYAVKIGPLAEAKKQFGIAKRVLSALGKSVIKAVHGE